MNAQPSQHRMLTCLLAWALLILLPLGAGAMPDEGDVPPDVLGQDAKGDPVRISAHRGKVVAVVFWASWCGQCKKEMPILEQFQRKAGKHELEVIAVSWKENKGDFRALRREMRSWQTTLTHDLDGKLAEQYGVRGVPHLVMVDREGVIAYVRIGFNSSDQSIETLIDVFNQLLAEPRPAATDDSLSAS